MAADGAAGALPPGDEVAVAHASGEGGLGEGGKGGAELAGRVAELEAADEDHGEQGAGDDAKLAGGGNGAGEAPVGVGDCDAHACRLE